MRIPRLSIPRLNFSTRIFLWGAFSVLLLLIAAFFAWTQVRDRGLLVVQRDMDESLRSFGTRLDEASLDQEDLGKWLTSQPDFLDMLESGGGANLAAYLERLVEAGMADSLTVTDSQGTVISRVSRNHPASSGESVLAEPGIRSALSGQTSRGFRRDEFNDLVLSLVFPIRKGGQNSPIGVLRSSIYLNNDFLGRMSGTSNAQLAYYFSDGDTVVLFGDPLHRSVLTKPMSSEALTVWREGRPSDFLTLDTVQGPYLFKFAPFQSLDSNLSGAYGVGIPLSAVPAGAPELFTAMMVAILFLAAFTCLAAYLLYRRYAVPLQTLGRAAATIAEGDLSVQMPLRDGELDGVGESINGMARRLRVSVDSITRERNRNQAIIKSMGAALIVTDEQNQIVDLNPASESLLGRGMDDVIGREWREIFVESKRPGEGNGFFREGEKAASSSEAFGLGLQGRYSLRKDPRVILDVISNPLEVDGRAAGYVHVLEDASDQEQFARARDEFMMNAAHELRTPLSSMRTAIEILNEEQSTMSHQELNLMIRKLRRSVLRFEAFVENLIDIGNVMAGRFVVRPTACKLDDILEAALGQVTPLLEARGQFVKVECNSSQPYRVFADGARITQVMVNLLTNASKYGPENEPIVLWICDDERQVSVDVSDRGNGISPEEQSKLFQRFYRGRRGIIEGSGLGLGLALTKEIVEAHGGQIGIKSQPGAGTTFRFSLLKAL